jgi:hypothetical protein
MRVTLALLALAVSVPAVAGGPAVPLKKAIADPPPVCRRTTPSVAGASSIYRGKPLTPQELTELPPANFYVAVLRHDANGCEDPIVVRYNVGQSR